ncbi:MAG: WD40 repeat domain-containing protein, partial [Blastocatellia bacterium]
WEVESGREIRRFEGHTGAVRSVSFSPNGRYALSGSSDATLRLWEVESGREIRRFEGHIYEVTSVSFSPDGRYALSGSVDKTMRLWEFDWEWEFSKR